MSDGLLKNKRVNKERGTCTICGCFVPENGGTEYDVQLMRSTGRTITVSACVHLACEVTGTAQVTQWRTGEGISEEDFAIKNINGRCEDAPCCGCCYP